MKNILKNSALPAPRWFRITKKIIYALAGSSILTGTLSKVGIPDDVSVLIIGWLLLIGETLNEILANGERYTKV